MIKSFTNWVIQKIYPKTVVADNPIFRSQIGYLEGWSSIFINLFLFIIKFIIGLASSSIALIADAFHTLSDLSTSIIIVISAKIAKKPSDMEHPFGHQRAEAISTIIIATLLFIAGIELGKSAVGHIVNPSVFKSNWLLIGIIFSTVIIKELLARFAKELGEIIQSTTLKADAWHHRSDAITTLLVLITFILGNFNIYSLDGYVGVFMALLIMYTGYSVSKEAFNHLLGSAPEPDFLNKIKKIAFSFPEVSNVHDIILHQYGDNKILSFHIEVPAILSLKRAHSIAEQVETLIEKKLRTHTTIHFEPDKSKNPAIDDIRNIIEKEIAKNDMIESYHAIFTKGAELEKEVFFDLVVRQKISENEIEKIRKNMVKILKHSLSNIKTVIIKIEPSYPFQGQLD